MGCEAFFLRLNGMTPPKRGNRVRRRIPGFLGCAEKSVDPSEKAAECKKNEKAAEHLSRQILEFRCVLKNDKDLNFWTLQKSN